MADFQVNRQYIYIAGNIIDPTQNNANEGNLYAAYNASLDGTDGHKHDGTDGNGPLIDSSGINLAGNYPWTGNHSWTRDLKLLSGADLDVYSDNGITLKAQIDGATGDVKILTAGGLFRGLSGAQGSFQLGLNSDFNFNISIKTDASTAVNAFNINSTGIHADVLPFITSNQYKSTLATGTAPFLIASTTEVTNLNANLLQGLAKTAFVIQDTIFSDNTVVDNNIGTIDDGGFVDVESFSYTVNTAGSFEIIYVFDYDVNGTFVVTETDFDLYDATGAVEIVTGNQQWSTPNLAFSFVNTVTMIGRVSLTAGAKTIKFRKQNTSSINISRRHAVRRFVSIKRIGS